MVLPPFYAVLRAVPDKLLGVVAMGASIVVLFLLPWFDRCKVRSYRYRSKLHLINNHPIHNKLYCAWCLVRFQQRQHTLLAQIFRLRLFHVLRSAVVLQ
ncbi:hypothetical protein O9992_11675 [Vibrio lentus]|nr:hypothetical protein [Vibrio lentus]